MAARSRPWGLHWRSKPSFILATVALGLFTDLFLYGIVVPVLPFMLRDRLSVPDSQIQPTASGLLAAYAGAAVLFAIPAGWIADKVGSRQPSFLAGLLLLLSATVMLAFGRSIPVLYAARVLQGMSAAVVWTAGLAMIQDTVGPGKMGQAIGTIFSIISVAELVAPVLGGILYDKAGLVAVFALATGVLAIDLVMRLLVIDNRSAVEPQGSPADESSSETPSPTTTEPGEAEAACERDPLLPRNDYEAYKIDGELGKLSQTIPILYCFREPKLLVALLLSFMQALLTGIFDATIPTEAQSLFHFTSLKVGLLFIAFVVPALGLGHFAGSLVDRHGTRIVATAGFAYLVPCLALLGLPSQRVVSGVANIVLFCAVLALNGVGLIMVGSPGSVEVTDIAQKYEAANPGFFGENGPYGQLYGFNTLWFFLGLTVGPLLGGVLRDTVGYAFMAAIAATLSGATAIASYCVL